VTAAAGQILRAAREEEFAIIAYCFMPEHLHMVVEGAAENSDLKTFISRAKQFSAYEHSQRAGKRLWQRYCFEHVIRDCESTQRQVAYVLQNPVRRGLVAEPADYPHIGSSLYTKRELLEFAFGGRVSEASR
jgi:putative transposase